MKNVKTDLKSFSPPISQGGDQIKKFIDNELDDKEALRCLNYMVSLQDTDHPHTIREIGYDENGNLYIQASSGITFI